MRKILARLAQGDSDDGSSTHNNVGGHSIVQHTSTGRRFKIGSFFLTVDDLIAEGGFGVVFRVVSQHGKVYALKRTCVNNERDLAVCKREITIVSSVYHKNILRYVDSKITVMQPGIYEILLLTAYYPGNLGHLLAERKKQQNRFSEVEILRIFCDVCEAVCRLHHSKTPIIHRDLKIENILIDELKNFVLCDFGSATSRILHPGIHGISRCEEEITKYTTGAYRAPEMINLSNNIPLGLQIDIWALGCMLYYLSFFSLPFSDNPLAIQSGNFFIPDTSPYCVRLHKLIGYILCVDAFKRPDIHQVCSLAFKLAGRSTPSQNLNNLIVPLWKDLAVPPRFSQWKTAQQAKVPSSRSTSSHQTSTTQSNLIETNQPNHCLDNIVTNTSVIPRERPRAAGQTHPFTPSSISNYPTQNVTNTDFVQIKKPPLPVLHITSNLDTFPNSVKKIVHDELSTESHLNNSVNKTGWEVDFNEIETEKSINPTHIMNTHSTDHQFPALNSFHPINHQFIKPVEKTENNPHIPHLHNHCHNYGASNNQYHENNSQFHNLFDSFMINKELGHRRFPSDISQLKSVCVNLRQVQSLASINFPNNHNNNSNCTASAVKSNRLNSTAINTTNTNTTNTTINNNMQDDCVNSFQPPPSSSSSLILSQTNRFSILNSFNTNTDFNQKFTLQQNQTDIHDKNDCSNNINVNVYNEGDNYDNDEDDDDDDDVLFGAVFDAIRKKS